MSATRSEASNSNVCLSIDGPQSSWQGSGPRSLLEFLDLSQVNCLNEAEDHNIKDIFPGKARNTTDSYLLSDADEQLLLNIHVCARPYERLSSSCLQPRYQFNQADRVKSVILHTADSQKGPKSIKLLLNRNAIDFGDVEDAEEPEVAQVLEVSEDTVKEGRPIDLRYVRFQSVNSLHVRGDKWVAFERVHRVTCVPLARFLSALIMGEKRQLALMR
jgi:hypothetical protein